MDIKQFIKQLAILNKIDFSGKKSEMGLLAQKYDKNQNSVFEEDEIQEMTDDLILSGNKDDNGDELSGEEARNFIKSISPKENSFKRFIKRVGKSLLPNSIIQSYRNKQNKKSADKLEKMFSELINTGKENRENIVENIIDEFKYRRDFSRYDLLRLYQLKTTDLERLTDFLYVEERGKDQFDIIDLEFDFAKLSDEELELAKKYLLHAEGRKKEFNSYEITVLAQLSEEELERAKKHLFHIKNREEQFDGYEIANLAKLSDDELEWAENNLYNVKGRKEQFSAYETADLAKVENKEFIKKYLKRDFSAYSLVNIANNYTKELEEYLDTHPKSIYPDSVDNYVRFSDYNDGIKYYTYDKTGLIETGEFDSIDDTDEIKSGYKKTYINTKLNAKHELVGGKHGPKKEYKVISEVLTYYDKNKNIIKTVTIKRNPQNGFINVSERDKDGKQHPIQWESVDPDTGAKITERHLTSPEGVKTDYYAEEGDTLKITDYKITDNDGNELINVYQTFQQVTENKYISSINTTGKDEDTQIYEMEYTDDCKVIIFDKKNNKTTEIDLKKYFENEESTDKLITSVRQLPGHVLLEFAEKPFKIIYNPKTKEEEDNEAQNGSWRGYDNELTIGNYENTVKEEKNLLATMAHELGHYIDGYQHTDNGIISSNQDVIRIYKEELQEFQSHATTLQQEHIDYFINGSGHGEKRGHEEKVAETHAIMNTTNDPSLNIRRLYLAQYFPRTMAAIMKLLLEEEGVKV